MREYLWGRGASASATAEVTGNGAGLSPPIIRCPPAANAGFAARVGCPVTVGGACLDNPRRYR